MTTHGHFYRRYSGGSGSSRSTAADSSARSLSASIEPSTCGTSWNSVRWNKPINLGFTHSSRISAMFNKPSTSTSSTTHSGGSSYSAPPAQRRPYKPLDTLTSHHGSFRNTQTPSFVHSTRASRDVPYRTRDSSREILSPKYTSGREVNDVPEKKCSYRSYYWHEPIKPVGVVKLMTIRGNEDNSYLKSRMSLSAPRDLYSTSTSRYSPRNSDVPTSARLTAAATDSSRSGRSLSAFATTTPSTARLMSPPKAERPWRQKLAESARLRNLHGDEVANAIGPKIAAHRANRRNSLTRNSENELETSLTALKSLVNMDKASPLSKYREKTGSAALSSYVSAAPFSFKTEAKPRMAESFNEGALAAAKLAMKQEENGPMTQSCAPLGSSSTLLANGLGTPSENNGQSLESVNAIPLVPDEMTSSVTRRRRSPSARTARRQSRQRSLSKSQSRKPSSSSSEAEAANGPREPPRVKRLKKKKSMQSQESLNGPAPETVKPVDDLLPAPTTSPPIRAEPAVVVEKETAVEPTPPLPEPQPKSSAQTKTPVPKTPSSPKIGPKAFQGKAAETAKTASAKSSPVLPKKTVPTAKQNGVAAEKPKTVATKKPASPKMVKKEMVKPVEVKKETVAKEPPKVEPVKAEAKKIEPAKTETKTLEPAKVEAKKVEKLEPKAKAVEEPSKTSNGPSAAKVAPKIDGVAKFVPKKAASTKPASPKTAKKVVNGKGPAAKAENVTEDEGKYSAVAHFIPLSMRKKEEKQPAPVPGTWKGPQAELYISHNKHLTKSDMTAKAEGTMKARPAMAIKSPKIKVPVKKKPPPVVTKSVLKTLTAKTANQTQRCLVNIPPQERAIATHTFKLKEKEPKKVLKETASATVSAELNASCKPLLKTDKTIKQPGKQVEKISFACTASKVATTEMSKELKRKAVTAGAKVTVLASIPLLDINIARLAMKFKVPQATKQYFTNLIEKQTAIIEDEKKKFIEAPKVDLDDVQSKAQKMLQRMREGFEDENCYASND
uniref:Protein kinase domain-containing protein n=1 Tax=Steinernema glaseri TaxID=37863 RepID=A0A1I8ARK8_9BILA